LNKKHQVSQNKRTKHRITHIRQTKTKEKNLGQHLTGKPKQKN